MLNKISVFSVSLFLMAAAADELDICSCPESDGQIRCTIAGGVTLNRESGCRGDSLRVSGDGFVTNAESVDGLTMVILERTTMTCSDGWDHFQNAREIVINGVACTIPTTSTKEPRPRPPARPEGPRRRPPIQPDDNDNDDDDDDDDNGDDNGDDNNVSDETTTTTSTTESTTITTTFRAIIVTSATLGHFWIVVALGVVVSGACVIVVVRVRYCKRQRRRPVQEPTVSSSTHDDDDNAMNRQSFVLREVPRSPRRRGSSSMDSVILYAVDEEL